MKIHGTATIYEFKAVMGHRSRECKFRIIHQGQVFSKEEAVKRNIAVFKAIDSQRNGKWSWTKWQVITKSAILVVCMSPFDGWPEDYQQCLEHIVYSSGGYTGQDLSIADAELFFQEAYPKTAARIKALDTAIDDLI